MTAAGSAASTQSSLVPEELDHQLAAGFWPAQPAVVARWLDQAARLSDEA